jgi:hypothetical protein
MHCPPWAEYPHLVAAFRAIHAAGRAEAECWEVVPISSARALPAPPRHGQPCRYRGIGVGITDEVLHRPLRVGAQCRPERRIAGEASVISGCEEAVCEAVAEVGYVTVARVQFEEGRLLTARPGIRRRAAGHLRPVSRQPLDVVRVLARMRERVVELGVGRAALVMCPGEAQERGVTPGVLMQRGPRDFSIAGRRDASAEVFDGVPGHAPLLPGTSVRPSRRLPAAAEPAGRGRFRDSAGESGR